MRTARWAVVLAAVCTVAAGAVAYAAEGSAQASGTAVVVSPDGHLLTCAHVVAEAAKARVRIGETEYAAAVLAIDEVADLALLKVEVTGLKAALLGGHDLPELGQRVWAFGFPLTGLLGESVKVTGGTVSGIGVNGAHKVIQVDAPVNPGNSGGPLVDETGGVVGIVNAKLTGENVSSIGFAIPVSYARSFLHEHKVEFGSQPDGAPMDGPAVAKAMVPVVALVLVEAFSPVVVGTVATGGYNTTFALSPDGKTVACSSSRTMQVAVWDVATGEVTRAMPLPDALARGRPLAAGSHKLLMGGVMFSPDGTILVSHVLPLGHVYWNASTGRWAGLVPTATLFGLHAAFSPDSEWLVYASGIADEDVEAFSLRSGATRVLARRRYPKGLAVAPDGRSVAMAFSALSPVIRSVLGQDAGSMEQLPGVEIIDLATGLLRSRLHPRTTGVHDISFSPDGVYLAGVDADPAALGQAMGAGASAMVTIWDLETGTIVRTLSLPGLVPSGVCFSPTGDLLAVQSARSGTPSVALWDTRRWEPVAMLPGLLGEWHAGAFSRDGRLLATTNEDHSVVTVWQVAQTKGTSVRR